jgi:hypothetical protein
MQGQPWQLGSSLSHLLGNIEDSRRPSASSRCFSFVLVALWWLDGCGSRWRQRQFIEEHLGQRTSWTGTETGWASRTGPNGLGSFRPGSTPVHSSTLLGPLLTCSLMHVGPWRQLLHNLDRTPCHASFNIFYSGPWSFTSSFFGPWAIFNHVHDVSWTVSGFKIFSWSAWWTYPEGLPLSASFLINNKLQNRHARVNLIPPGG